jgi:hypothetical protein
MSDSKPLIPASYIFSYWIFIWAVIYIVIKYIYQFSNAKLPKQIQWMNPSLILLVATIWNVESLIMLFYQNASSYIMFKVTLMILCIKIIPLWFIWTYDINLYRDLGIVFVLFLVYCIYLWIHNTDFNTVYIDLTESVENDENRTPFEYLFEKIRSTIMSK